MQAPLPSPHKEGSWADGRWKDSMTFGWRFLLWQASLRAERTIDHWLLEKDKKRKCQSALPLFLLLIYRVILYCISDHMPEFPPPCFSRVQMSLLLPTVEPDWPILTFRVEPLSCVETFRMCSAVLSSNIAVWGWIYVFIAVSLFEVRTILSCHSEYIDHESHCLHDGLAGRRFCWKTVC